MEAVAAEEDIHQRRKSRWKATRNTLSSSALAGQIIVSRLEIHRQEVAQRLLIFLSTVVLAVIEHMVPEKQVVALAVLEAVAVGHRRLPIHLGVTEVTVGLTEGMVRPLQV